MDKQCIVVIYGQRCAWPPHDGNVHYIWGKAMSAPPEQPLREGLLTRLRRWWRRG